MNDWWKRVGHAVALLAWLVLSGACGIDQGGAPSPSVESPQALIVFGPISGFGSVDMNGLSLESSTAQITVDGNPAAESDLRAGQVIRAVVSSEAGSNEAVLIEYQEMFVARSIKSTAQQGR